YLSYYFHYVSFFFSSRRRHTRSKRDWSSDVCSSDLTLVQPVTANLSEVIFFITEEQSLKHLAGCFRIRHFTGSYLPINLAQCRFFIVCRILTQGIHKYITLRILRRHLLNPNKVYVRFFKHSVVIFCQLVVNLQQYIAA